MSTAHEYRNRRQDTPAAELAHVIKTIRPVFAGIKTPDAVWLVTDADCRVALSIDGRSGSVRSAKEGLPAGLLSRGRNAFKGCLATGGIEKVLGRDHDRHELHNSVTLAVPVSSQKRAMAAVGCLLPDPLTGQVSLELVESLLCAAACACEQALRAWQTERWLTLLRHYAGHLSPGDPCLLVDAGLRVAHITPAAQKLLQCTESSLLGRDVRDFCSPGLARTLQALPSETAKTLPSKADGSFTCGGASHSVTFFLTALSGPQTEADNEAPRLGWSISLDGETARTVKPESPAAIPVVQAGSDTGTRYVFSDIVCADAGHIQQLHFARRMAGGTSNILITGESGTGKELYAQAMHCESPFASGPFVALNCACLPRDLIEAELFGYQEGAFTGAKKGGNQGKILLAHKGTLFLDEIGDMPLELQSKLLRVLQERSFVPVGGTRLVPVTFRLIAATNKDLAEQVAAGQFRSDLYYRINVVHIQLMPLRDRPGDILPLAGRFLKRYSSQRGIRAEGFSPEAETLLLRHDWPGNVRELENVIEFVCNMLDGPRVELRHLPHTLTAPRIAAGVACDHEQGHVSAGPSDSLPGFSVDTLLDPREERLRSGKITSYASMNMEEYSLQLILKAMNQCGGNINEAARMLGIGRSTLYRKLKKMDFRKRFRIVASDYVSPELVSALSDFCEEQLSLPPRYVRPDEYSAEVSRYAWLIAQNEQIRQFVRDLEPGVVHGPKELVRVLREIPERDTKVASIYIAVEKTNRIYGPLVPLYPKGYDVAGRVWYREAVERKSLIFTNPYLCPLTGEHVLTTAAPILKDDGSTIAVVGVDVLVNARSGENSVSK